MKKYLEQFIQEHEQNLKNKKIYNSQELEIFKTKISFFQHERLIHLLVTLSYASL